MATSHPVDQVLIEIGSIDKYCTASKESATHLSFVLKKLYDRSVADSRKRIGPLLNLSTEGLDDETIWEQLQTRNKPLTRFATKMAKRLKKRVEQNEALDEDSESGEAFEYEEDMENDRMDDDQIAEGEGSDDSAEEMSQDDQLPQDDDEEDDDADFDEERDDYEHSDQEVEDAEEDIEEPDDGAASGDSEDDMEAFLDGEDEKEMRRFYKEERAGKNKGDDVSDGEEDGEDDLALVQQHMYGDGSDDDDEDTGADYKFSDFFVADKPKAKKAEQKVAAKNRSSGSVKVKKRAADSDSDDDMSAEGSSEPSGDEGDDWGEEGEDAEGFESEADGDGDDGATGKAAADKAVGKGKNGAPTPLQQRKAALSTQIASLEEELMASKPWELRGEVKAADRPENSFLSLHADIERTSKPAPIVTQAFTSSMEDMIRRRIKESNFSDVLPPKHAKTDEPTAVEDLSQEKNKLGLGEVYAEEFLAKSLNAQPEAVSKRLEQDRLEAQDLFHKVSRQLDALSNFHFTPRPVVPESRASTLQPHASASAVSSLLLEDVTPVTAQGSTSQLAPEEVFGKKRGLEASLKSLEELTSDDRQRQRRASKAVNKAKKSRALDDNAVSGLDTSAGAARERARADERALDEQLRNDSRVMLTTASHGGPASKKAKTSAAAPSAGGDVSYAKSSSFFSKLQQESANLVKKKATTGGAKSAVTNPFARTSNSMKL